LKIVAGLRQPLDDSGALWAVQINQLTLIRNCGHFVVRSKWKLCILMNLPVTSTLCQ
jgi:hypothetical protein